MRRRLWCRKNTSVLPLALAGLRADANRNKCSPDPTLLHVSQEFGAVVATVDSEAVRRGDDSRYSLRFKAHAQTGRLVREFDVEGGYPSQAGAEGGVARGVNPAFDPLTGEGQFLIHL